MNKKDLKFKTPIYLPDATRAVTRAVDSTDLKNAKVEGMVVNTYHLMTEPGSSLVKEMGGVKGFMNWDGLIITDSGGFQVMSIIHSQKSFGKITDEGVTFNKQTPGGRKKYKLTPEKSIQVQFDLGSDIKICLDDFSPVGADDDAIKVSVDRTIEWAKRCRAEFDRLCPAAATDRPFLLAVIQGDTNKKERERCAKELIKIGFDGFGFGGWPMKEDGTFDYELMEFVASLMPDDKLKFALGVGNPNAIVRGYSAGYDIFDCVLPTRDGRHGRLYVFESEPENLEFGFVYIEKEKYARDNRPISEHCDCHTCQNYSRAYLRHLFKIQDANALRLATIHNLRTYTRLIEVLRNQ